MLTRTAGLIFALIAMVIAPAFAQNSVTVNGKPITNAKVDRMVQQVVAQGNQPDSPQLRESAKLDLIGREVLMQEAEKQGFGNRPDVKARLADLERRATNNVLDDFFKKNPAKETEVKAEYDRQKVFVDYKEYRADYIMVQASDTQLLGIRADVDEVLENIRQTVISNTLLVDYVKTNPITDAEIKAEFDRFNALNGNTEYHVRHILVLREDEAEALIAKIKSGSAFESLAKSNSKDGSATNGGDLGWSSPVQFVAPFSQAMIAMQKGSITEIPVKSQYGYHIIKLEDTRPAKSPALAEVKELLTEALQKRKLQAFRDQLVRNADIQ